MLLGLFALAIAASETTLVDLHIDTVHQVLANGGSLTGRRTEVNLATMRAGDVGAALFAIWVPSQARDPAGYADRAYAAFRRMLAETKGAVVQARSAAEVRAAWAAGKRAALLAMEGAHPLGSDPERLRLWKSRGLVALGLTWQNSNAFAESAASEARRTTGRGGLTALGWRLVALADQLGVVIDLAHASPTTLRDVLAASKFPPFVSHTACRAICGHFRNLTDGELRAVGEKGGVIGLTFHAPHVRCGKAGRAAISDVVAQLARIAKVAGADAVAIGSDFDGMIVKPRGLPNAAAFPQLRAALRGVGLDDVTLSKLFQGNALRILSRSDTR